MGSEADYEASSIPKLSLFSFPTKPPKPKGILTPPPQVTASVPFQWEEAPGKPRPCSTAEPKPKHRSARSLELPPRLLLLSESKITNIPSPTTVLDGPYVGRSISYRFSLRSPDSLGGKRLVKEKGRSTRWGSFRKNIKEVVEGTVDFKPSPVVNVGGGGGGDSDTKVKITRVKKRSVSLLNLSHTRTRSHLLASIYDSLKQAVPWRRRQERIRKMDS
jgi:hypothetical protein